MMHLWGWLKPSIGWLKVIPLTLAYMWCWQQGHDYAMAESQALQNKAMQAVSRDAFQAGFNAAKERQAIDGHYREVNQEVRQYEQGDMSCAIDNGAFDEWVRLHNRLANPGEHSAAGRRADGATAGGVGGINP